jgi:CubicO group peptidase (beta-lactamase class C family)
MADGDIGDVVARTARERGLSGVVRVDRGDRTVVSQAFGLADRRNGTVNRPDTRFGVASGTKGFTALTVMSLVADGTLALDTPARSLLGDDLPMVDDAVTIEHLLAHRSGIGDYLDESEPGDINDHVLVVPAHQLENTEAYLQIVDGFPQRERPGETFRYNNGGFIVLALLAERAGQRPFHQLVHERVISPAGLTATSFDRSDELPGDVAIGYLHDDGLRSNVFHLPVTGSGDGGIITSAADVHRFWQALFADRIVPAPLRQAMVEPVSDAPSEDARYGLGFWLHASRPAVILVGIDPGVSFRSLHDAETATTATVISNTSGGTWPMAQALETALGFA